MTIGKNFCLAPFTQITMNPLGGYSPCPEIGGRPWQDPGINVQEMWCSQEFEDLRNSFKLNTKNTICDRCWHQEAHGNQSLRKRLFLQKNNGVLRYEPGEILPLIEQGYQSGPKQMNLMVGNICNLRCRICTAASSVTYNVEGRHYKEKYGRDNKRYISINKKPTSFSAKNINDIFDISTNLQRIEFYGGEPMLDEPTLDLLDRFVDTGRSRDITLFYNTNGTVAPSERHLSLWNQFRAIEFNFSIDDIEERFSYARHPAKWSDLTANLFRINQVDWQVPIKMTSICTVSILNIYYLPEILERLHDMQLPCFLNHIYDPKYYDIRNLPNQVKTMVETKLRSFPGSDRIMFLINMLSEPDEADQWEDFKFWTKVKDEYRQESFAAVYPEFYDVIKAADPTFVG